MVVSVESCLLYIWLIMPVFNDGGEIELVLFGKYKT